jgi:hypothetical protein
MKKAASFRIHTLDARGHMMFEVMQDVTGADDAAIGRQVVATAQVLSEALAKQGVAYEKLGPALMPQQDKKEIALFWDSYQ